MAKSKPQQKKNHPKGVVTNFTRQMSLIGNNIIVHGNTAYALYVITPHNYHLSSDAVNEDRVEKLVNMIEVLSSTIPNLVFSIFKSSYIFGRDEKIRNLNKTAQICNNQDAHQNLTKDIQSSLVDNTLIAIKLNLHSTKDVEEIGVKDIFKSIYNNTTTAILNERVALRNLDNLTAVEKRIRRSIMKYAHPVNRNFMMSAYLRSIYPNYNLAVDGIEGHHVNLILGELNQRYDPYFGFFKMTNDGVEIFGAAPVETYGTVLMIKEYPNAIYSENMNLDIAGAKTTIRVLDKGEASKKFGRLRADIEFEHKNATIAGARDTQELDTAFDLVNQALTGGNTACEFNSYITIVDTDFENLKNRRQKLISELREIGIIAMPAADQVRTYIDNYIMLAGDEKQNAPGFPSNFYHLSDLRFPLSFQTDAGSMIGDFDAIHQMPEIGSSL